MSKLEKEQENPLDNYIIELCEKMTRFIVNIEKFVITPNHITIIGGILGMSGVYFLYKRNLPMFALFTILYYILDCLDGFYARKHNLVSKLGDILDHSRDVIVFVSILVVLFINYKRKITIGVIVIFLILSILMNFHICLQQKIYVNSGKKNEEIEETLDFFNYSFLEEEHVYYTRFFGTGSYIVYIILLAFYLEYKK